MVSRPRNSERGGEYEDNVANSPFGHLIRQLETSGRAAEPWLHLQLRLAGPLAQFDFPNLEGHAAAGATDYFAEVFRFGMDGDPSRGTGIGYSFTTDRAGGFADDDILLLQAVLPAASLAMMTQAGYTVAAGLLAAYLGADAGRRVHAGAVARGSVETIRAVLWYADIRGFTEIADGTPGLAVIEMLNEIFETLTAPLRARGGQVLKFMGDGMLAIFSSTVAMREETCGRALDAAIEAMLAIDRLNDTRRAAGKPIAIVDLALHLGEVLYGNVGAADRLDFTVIGPAVNEAARIETLCEPLGYKVLVSAEFAAAVTGDTRLRRLGRHRLRGVRKEREVYALDLGT
jgi:adenylate cyclase